MGRVRTLTRPLLCRIAISMAVLSGALAVHPYPGPTPWPVCACAGTGRTGPRSALRWLSCRGGGLAGLLPVEGDFLWPFLAAEGGADRGIFAGRDLLRRRRAPPGAGSPRCSAGRMDRLHRVNRMGARRDYLSPELIGEVLLTATHTFPRVPSRSPFRAAHGSDPVPMPQDAQTLRAHYIALARGPYYFEAYGRASLPACRICTATGRARVVALGLCAMTDTSDPIPCRTAQRERYRTGDSQDR